MLPLKNTDEFVLQTRVLFVLFYFITKYRKFGNPRNLKIYPVAEFIGVFMLIDVKNVTFAYYGSAEPVFENLNLQLDTDWKLGLIGRNGYGKTTFLKLLQNKLEYSGKIISPVSSNISPMSLKKRILPARPCFPVCLISKAGSSIASFPYWKLLPKLLIDPLRL